MGSFTGIFLKDGAHKPNIPEDKKEEFFDRAVKLLNTGGMMKMDKVSIFGIDIVSFKKLQREDAEDGRLTWHYNYFENDFWEWAGIDLEKCYLWSNKVGNGKFAITMMAAYVLESLYTEDSAAVDFNGRILGEISQTGWINYLFDEHYTCKNENLWDLYELMQETDDSKYHTGKIRWWNRVTSLEAFYGYLQVTAVEKGVDAAMAVMGDRDTQEMADERHEKGAVNLYDMLKVVVGALRNFKGKSGLDEEEQFRQVCNVIRDFYGGEDNDGFGQRYTGRDDVPHELGALAFGMNFMPTPALLIKAVAETWDKDFWELWKEFRDLIRHSKRTVHDMIEVPQPSAKLVSTMEYLEVKPDDMAYYWTPGCDIVFSDDLEEQFQKWRRRYDDLMEQEFHVESPLKWMLGLLQYANARYYYIFAFSDFVNESAEHLSERRYLALWKILEEMLQDPQMLETVEPIFKPLPAEEAGRVYPPGKEPCRQIQWEAQWREGDSGIKGNRARLLLRRYLALVANRELREKVFAF